MVSGTLISSGYIQSELKEESRETSRNVSNRKRAHTLNEDTSDSQSPASGGYISLVAHIWVGDDGRVIRGTIEDAHTGAQLAVDFSALAALLQELHDVEAVRALQDVAHIARLQLLEGLEE